MSAWLRCAMTLLALAAMVSCNDGEPGRFDIQLLCGRYCDATDECPPDLPPDFPLTCVELCSASMVAPCGSELFDLRECNLPVDACRMDAEGCEAVEAAYSECVNELVATCGRCDDLVLEGLCRGALGYCVEREQLEECEESCPENDFGRILECLGGRRC